MRRICAAALSAWFLLFTDPVHADDDWEMEIVVSLGASLFSAPGALPGLESSPGFVLGVGPRFVSESGTGFGGDYAIAVDLDGAEDPSFFRATFDLFLLLQKRYSDEGTLTLTAGPSAWISSVSFQDRCLDDCAPKDEALADLFSRHDSAVIGGNLGLSFEDSLGGDFLFFGVEVRARAGFAVADDQAPLRWGLTVAAHYMFRLDL